MDTPVIPMYPTQLLQQSLRRTAASLLITGLLAACAPTAPTAPDPGRPHHRAEGFQNNYIEFKPKPLSDLLAWRWQSWREGKPPAPKTATPQIQPDLAFLQANARAGAAMQPAVTWIGHATVLVQLGGLNLLTDPTFSERAFPVQFLGPKRAQPPGLALRELPHIDAVLISHNHYDHLDLASVQALAAQPGGAPLFIVPLGLKAWFAAQGIVNVVELDWWQAQRVGAVEVVMTPVQHWSARSFNDQLETLWGGYALFAPDLHLYFAGDTGYSKDFADIRARFAERQRDGGGFDIALLPIGGYEPRWFMQQQHVNPAEAVQIHRDLGAQRSLGVHWGSFELTDEALDEPPIALAAARRAAGLADDDFFVIALGQTRRLQPRKTGR